MTFAAHPMVVAVAFGLLPPSVLEIDADDEPLEVLDPADDAADGLADDAWSVLVNDVHVYDPGARPVPSLADQRAAAAAYNRLTRAV